MPNRLIRDGFLDSEAIHALSDAAECFFHRLLLAADDAGRMDGRVEILRARLFPLDLSRRASDVEKTLNECIAQGLVIPYEWDGKRCLQISRWQKCSPSLTSKYPDQCGAFKIAFSRIETRDGEKDFVTSSLSGNGGVNGGEPIRNPGEYSGKGYARDTDGMPMGCDPSVSVDVDVDVDVDERVVGSGEPLIPSPKQAKPKGQNISLQSFLDTCREAGEVPIPDDGAVFAYAAKVGLPEDYLALSWRRFKTQYATKKQAGVDGWRKTFLNAVKGNWGNLWAIGRQGEYYLTTTGKQAEREMLAEESGS